MPICSRVNQNNNARSNWTTNFDKYFIVPTVGMPICSRVNKKNTLHNLKDFIHKNQTELYRSNAQVKLFSFRSFFLLILHVSYM